MSRADGSWESCRVGVSDNDGCQMAEVGKGIEGGIFMMRFGGGDKILRPGAVRVTVLDAIRALYTFPPVLLERTKNKCLATRRNGFSMCLSFSWLDLMAIK